jgi:esterase FrsA
MKTMKILTTPESIRFGLIGRKKSSPCPTLLMLGHSIENMLGNKDFNPPALILQRQGFIAVSVDAPGHGQDLREGEADDNLKLSWRPRLLRGERMIDKFAKKVSLLLNYLIRNRYTDPRRIAALGISRGGFLALHLAAREKRVGCVAAVAPVVDLLAVREFGGLDRHPVFKALHLVNYTRKLANLPIWICIGNNDDRVDTDRAFQFVRKLVIDSADGKKPVDVQIHVMPTLGHAAHATAYPEAAAWILGKLG